MDPAGRMDWRHSAAYSTLARQSSHRATTQGVDDEHGDAGEGGARERKGVE